MKKFLSISTALLKYSTRLSILIKWFKTLKNTKFMKLVVDA